MLAPVTRAPASPGDASVSIDAEYYDKRAADGDLMIGEAYGTGSELNLNTCTKLFLFYKSAKNSSFVQPTVQYSSSTLTEFVQSTRRGQKPSFVQLFVMYN